MFPCHIVQPNLLCRHTTVDTRIVPLLVTLPVSFYAFMNEASKMLAPVNSLPHNGPSGCPSTMPRPPHSQLIIQSSKLIND